MSDDSEIRNLTLVYEENAKVLAIFLEWRHKVMTHWFAVTGAAFVAAAWLSQQSAFRSWLFAPFLLGAIFSTISFFLDLRNVRILQECYRIGGEIELKLVGTGAIFKFIGHTHSRGVTYTRVLRIAYLGVACLFLMLSIFSAVFIR
jgi:hypothetical protein